MKFFKYMFVAAAALAMTACSDDSVDYEWAEKETGAQVYFSSEAATSLTLSSVENSFTIDVNRVKSDDAITVPLTATADEGKFSVPSSVSFASGQSVAKLNVGYDADAIGFDKETTLTIKIGDQALATQYGMSEITITAKIPAPWTNLGKCTITDDYIIGRTSKVNIYQNDINPEQFRIEKPFGGADFSFKLLEQGSTFYGVPVEASNWVGYTDLIALCYASAVGTNIGYVHPARFNGCEDYIPGNEVTMYQSNGLPAVVKLSPMYYDIDNGGAWYPDGQCVQIVFPGVVLKDYSIDMEYVGKFVGMAGNVGATADITLGEDVASAKFVVVSGIDPEEGLAAMEEYAEGVVEVEAGTTRVNVPMPADAASGNYYLVGATFDEDGKMQESASVQFRYVAVEREDWQQIGTCSYVYTLMFADDDGSPYYDKGLPIYQNANNKSQYMVDGCMYGIQLYFSCDPETGVVTIEDDQYTAYDSSYGPVFVGDALRYIEPEEEGYDELQPGKFDAETGVFSFPIAYYCSLGWFYFGEEYIILDPADEATPSGARSVAVKTARDMKPHYTKTAIYKKFGAPIWCKIAE